MLWKETCHMKNTPIGSFEPNWTDTHAEKASPAPGVAKHLLHTTVLQGVGMLANKLVSIGGMQWAAALGLQQHVREQEEHLGLSVCTFRRNHF